ncbi:MAG: hypothetical protein EF807_08730 [Candidatus Methanolliviera hydrocarbonicum]|uniref:4Fe-4S ferredoxin-type domain-containing protein n=1 Tax=Candidatus Methanolliviera hydrocarbonicum TaxID=2491085 RepID=A0A520KVJ3_9EURY|nr:MAG: hypothetical protein EF807_08730 [Candidatus Methanolliviera hydrocarbonicum]
MSKVQNIKGPDDLQRNVLDEELCTGCGACTNLCPYIDMVKANAIIIEPCGLSKGRCYNFCPRSYIDVPSLDKSIFGSYREDIAIGSNIYVMKARAKDEEIRSAAQYGGVVSALIIHALQTGKIDAAVLATSSDGVNPKPTIARSKKEVLECVGSKYIVSPTVSKVLDAIKGEMGKIGVVCTPCQMTAIRKMQDSPFETGEEKISLGIGLFCTWCFSPDTYEYIRSLVGSANILKTDIPPPPANIFVIQTDERRVEVPLDEIRKFIMPSCAVCFDMTNEFSDISVGTVEGEEDWNTVIVRTRNGERFLKSAKEAAIIETKPLEKEKFNHLCEASLNRKKRALKEIDGRKITYLTIRDEERSKIISWNGGI